MASNESLVRAAPLPDILPTIGSFFRQAVALYPDHVALSCPHQSSDLFGMCSIPLDADEYREKPWLRWSYTVFKQCVDRFASGLRAHGISCGTSIVTFLPNVAEYMICFWAADALGCSFVPINPKNLTNVAEVDHMLRTMLSVGPSSEGAVIIAGSDTMEKVDVLAIPESTLKCVVGVSTSSDWVPFEQLCQPNAGPGAGLNKHDDGFESSNLHSLVMFTSGTTSLPKGCLLDQDILRATYMQWKIGNEVTHRPDTIVCHALPNNHMAAMHYMLHTLSEGGMIMHPGPSFDPDLLLKMSTIERCTLLLLVPAALQGVVAAAAGLPKVHSLESITLGGAAPTIRDIELAYNGLGTPNVEHVFGMTEGVVTSTGRVSSSADIVRNGLTTCGKARHGSCLKICAPGERHPVPRGVPGELHASGPYIVRGYIGLNSDSFYKDSDGRSWFNTGDQAFIDDEDFLFISGRYKEMLIRGAENISPAAVEAAISTVPDLALRQIQITGVPDEAAGQVLVAISAQVLDSATQKRVRNVIIDRMGTMFVPETFYHLEELGLATYPTTSLGKIQKIPLAAIIAQHRGRKLSSDYTFPTDNREIMGPTISLAKLQDTLRKTWARAVGLDVVDVPLNLLVTEFADSVTAMRVRSMIRKQVERDITLVELTTTTIEQQAQLLHSRPPFNVSNAVIATKQRPGPPLADDMTHLAGREESLEDTKQLVERTLTPLGLSWDDVEDVIPAYDFNQVISKARIVDSLTWNFAILPKKFRAADIGAVIEKLLKVHPLFRSFFIRDTDTLNMGRLALHIIMRPRPSLLSRIILQAGSVKTVADLAAIVHNYPTPSHAIIPGPMAVFTIYTIEESGLAGFILRASHTMLDASYGRLLLEDIERVCGGLSPNPHVDYKLWADCYYSFRDSPQALAATKYHIRQLADLSAHRNALWPPRSSWMYSRASHDGYRYAFDCPGIITLRKRNPVLTPSAIFKSALVLLNVSQTGHSHALFSNMESARTAFPFLPASMAQLPQLDPIEVAGQCMTSVINLISLRDHETLLAFLARIQDDQTNSIRYAEAPWHGVMDGLNDAGHLLPEVLCHQIFNWVPELLTLNDTDTFDNFRVVDTFNGPVIGLGLTAAFGGKTGVAAAIHLRGIGTSLEEKKRLATKFESLLMWLVNEANWSKGMGEEWKECL
ncbi:acetyl-CoA synthetase-like protein [Pseudovirgaria hyperparasitica]|uniref:Acetyl-CoA synthetase-like protein n=1 Tax=Pseudovirgaria hyperparasitica TaxID=470096 RepID=A0A6A6W7J8_9PEZI|nr:acetyl-CoA synthetase-like protein [Pseudovirgaria hyperparasitica]KAF2758868.1 acetyl-CoA synthetase-like protein [Pseudovirgaria hyperparasitica]